MNHGRLLKLFAAMFATLLDHIGLLSAQLAEDSQLLHTVNAVF
jgi:hypothetical protein